MSTTLRPRAVINRENAQKSTGPRTEAGKKRSAMNAVRHSLTGQIVVMPTDDLEAFIAFQKSFFDHHKPEGPDESQLVQFMVNCAWKIHRNHALQDQILCQEAFDELPHDAEDAPRIGLGEGDREGHGRRGEEPLVGGRVVPRAGLAFGFRSAACASLAGVMILVVVVRHEVFPFPNRSLP